MDLISGDDRNDVVCAGPGNDRFFGGGTETTRSMATSGIRRLPV